MAVKTIMMMMMKNRFSQAAADQKLKILRTFVTVKNI